MDAGHIPGDDTRLRSERFVTTGLRNVFHRSFLYGLGLSKGDMRRPFVGLAVAHNEASAGQAFVRALGDGLKRAASSAGLTEREFIVPESTGMTVDAVAARELVADSAELVVRGHWYDGLIGAAGSLQSAAGLAEAIVRLNIPGVVMIPNEQRGPDPSLDEFVDVLEHLGLGKGVDVNDGLAMGAAVEKVAADIRERALPSGVRDRVYGGLPIDILRADVMTAMASIAHEVGVTDAAAMVSSSTGLTTARISIGDVMVDALVGRGVQGSVRVERSGDTLLLRAETGDSHVIVAPSGLASVGARSAVVLRAQSEFDALRDAVTAQVTARVDNVEVASAPFSISALAGSTHPGAIDSELNYDRL